MDYKTHLPHLWPTLVSLGCTAENVIEQLADKKRVSRLLDIVTRKGCLPRVLHGLPLPSRGIECFI